MGVLGLVPFLRKTCPEVVKKLPDRLQSLNGKTIAFDGTLITQRFSYAPMPYEYRHVLGWYRLITELKGHNVQAICVFDGKERTLAKAPEVMPPDFPTLPPASDLTEVPQIRRRRQIKLLDDIRKRLEIDRLRRLRKLTEIVNSHWFTRDTERTKTSDALRIIASQKLQTLSSVTVIPDYGGNAECSNFQLLIPRDDSLSDLEIRDILDHIPESRSISSTSVDTTDLTSIFVVPNDVGFPEESEPFEPSTTSGVLSADVDEISLSQLNLEPPMSMSDLCLYGKLPSANEAHVDKLCGSAEVKLTTSVPCLSPDTLASPPDTESLSTSAGDMSSGLVDLYLNYRQSIPSTTRVTASAALFEPPHADQNMSKTQSQLISEEGRVWDQLANPDVLGVAGSSITDIVSKLTRKSSVLLEMYERRTHTPSAQTYAECKELLSAMGIPCVESHGPYEGEALAASLVLHGHADYVASEDTDVLIYEAPLIRNITHRSESLVILSGSEARSTLHLDRKGWIDFALLLGTDFSRRIKNVGPHRALKFIRQYGTIENLIKAETGYLRQEDVDHYLAQIRRARHVYETLPAVPDLTLLKSWQSKSSDVSSILQKYGLRWAANCDWDYTTALYGQYFDDGPSARVRTRANMQQ